MERFNDAKRSGMQSGVFRYKIVSKKSMTIHDWIEMVEVGLHQFQFLEMTVICTHTNPDHICSGTLHKYINKVTAIVETKISNMLPSRFALVFYGFSHVSTHYVAVFATYPENSKIGYHQGASDLCSV